MSQFVTYTPLSAMRALGSPAERSLPRLGAVLAREFGDTFGAVLAEPVHRKDGTGIDWYVETDEKLTPLADLPTEVADSYRRRLAEIVARVTNAAAMHEARSEAAGRSTASALRNAISFPGENQLWIAGGQHGYDGQIVITGWGYEQHDAENSGRGEIRARIASPRRPEPTRTLAEDITTAEEISTVGRARDKGFRWPILFVGLLALAPLALAVWIALLLLPACAAKLPFGSTIFGWGNGIYCGTANAQPLSEARRSQALIAEVAVLEEQVRRHLLSCIREEESVAPQTPSATQDTEADRRVEENLGGQVDEGDARVTLVWNDRSDLDLYVFCPTGEYVGLRSQRACNAIHDIDQNAQSPRSDPVENVTWSDGGMPSGHYRVAVSLYSTNDASVPVPFELQFTRGGDRKILREKVSAFRQRQIFMEFDVP